MECCERLKRHRGNRVYSNADRPHWRRLDKLIPNPMDRRKLFGELDNYIRAVIDHMIAHSGLDFDEYQTVREQMRLRC